MLAIAGDLRRVRTPQPDDHILATFVSVVVDQP